MSISMSMPTEPNNDIEGLESVLDIDDVQTNLLLQKRHCEFSLSRAHKVIKKMKDELGKIPKEYGMIYVTPKLLSTNKGVLNSEKTRLEINFITYYLLKNDMTLLRNKLYNSNGEYKLDDILSKIDILKELKTQYLSLTKNTKITQLRIENIDDTLIQTLSSDMYTANVQQQVTYYNVQRLEEIIDRLSKDITKLENKRDHINATKKIDIELTLATCNIIGL